MRPLTHLGLGPDSIDYELYSTNEALYDILSDRGEQLLEDAKKSYMGHYYNNPPKPTLKELQEDCDNWLQQKKRLEEMRAPKTLTDVAEENVIELYQDIQNKNYGSMSDPVYKQYLEAYCKKENDWHQSKDKETTLNEIYAYNEVEYNNFKLQQDFAPR
jgi:TPP-dependent 2-oxoacid decarboxylase